jgi:hypothetical protein
VELLPVALGPHVALFGYRWSDPQEKNCTAACVDAIWLRFCFGSEGVSSYRPYAIDAFGSRVVQVRNWKK